MTTFYTKRGHRRFARTKPPDQTNKDCAGVRPNTIQWWNLKHNLKHHGKANLKHFNLKRPVVLLKQVALKIFNLKHLVFQVG